MAAPRANPDQKGRRNPNTNHKRTQGLGKPMVLKYTLIAWVKFGISRITFGGMMDKTSVRWLCARPMLH